MGGQLDHLRLFYIIIHEVRSPHHTSGFIQK